MRLEETDSAVLARVALFERHRAGLLRLVVRRLGRWTEAQEVVADLAVEVVEGPMPNEPAAGRRWLLQRASRLASRRREAALAREQRARTLALGAAATTLDDSTDLLEGELVDSARPPDEEVAGRALAQGLQAAIARLSADDRALLLACSAGPAARRAATAGLTDGQAKGRLQAARRRLWELLDGDLRAEIELLL